MFPRKFTKDLRLMRESGMSLEDSLSRLRSDGASIVECIIAVKEERACELSEAKRLVHASKAWHDVAKATNKMWDQFVDELENKKA